MRKVYLDNTSTTPLLHEVRRAMTTFLDETFGNLSSLHDWGDNKGRFTLLSGLWYNHILSPSVSKVFASG